MLQINAPTPTLKAKNLINALSVKHPLSRGGVQSSQVSFCTCIGQFAFQKRLLARDSFEAHITDEVKRKLTTSETEPLIVPGGCTKFIQAHDFKQTQVLNKPFKARIQEFYNGWLANGFHEYTTAGIVQWVLQTWESLSKAFIINSVKSCALGSAVRGSENDKISCFHEVKKISDGIKRLENQIKLSSTSELNEDPFTHTEEDIAAAPSFTIIDENDDVDVNIKE